MRDISRGDRSSAYADSEEKVVIRTCLYISDTYKHTRTTDDKRQHTQSTYIYTPSVGRTAQRATVPTWDTGFSTWTATLSRESITLRLSSLLDWVMRTGRANTQAHGWGGSPRKSTPFAFPIQSFPHTIHSRRVFASSPFGAGRGSARAQPLLG